MRRPSVLEAVHRRLFVWLAAGWPGEKSDLGIPLITKWKSTLMYDSTAAARVGVSWKGGRVYWSEGVRTSALLGCFVYSILSLLVWIHVQYRISFDIMKLSLECWTIFTRKRGKSAPRS